MISIHFAKHRLLKSSPFIQLSGHLLINHATRFYDAAPSQMIVSRPGFNDLEQITIPEGNRVGQHLFGISMSPPSVDARLL